MEVAMLFKLPITMRDIALLVARLLIGVVIFPHGWEKWITLGPNGTAAMFTRLHVPFPLLSGILVGTVELVSVPLLILGVFTAVVGVLIVLDMAGAIITLIALSWQSGMFRGDFGLATAILATALLLATYGAGKYSLDHALSARQRSEQSEPI
jgi:putative oxidoreductase